MPVDYAEPTRLQDFKIDVLPPNSNSPVLTKQAGSNVFTPVGNSSIVQSRNAGLGRPSNLPPTQSNLRNEGQYRTIDLRPSTRGGYASSSYPQYRQIPSKISDPRYPNGVNAVDVEGSAAAGAFVLGVYDQLTGTNPVGNPNARRQNQREAFRPLDDIAYRLGRRTAGGMQDIVNDAKEGIKKTRDEIWRNRPRFEIPDIKLPDVTLPDFKFPDFPELKFPEISFPKPRPIPPPRPRPIPPPKSLKDKITDLEFVDCGGAVIKIAYVAKVLRSELKVNLDGSITSYLVKEQSSIDELVSVYRTNNPNGFGSTELIIESGGGTGTEIFREDYRVYPFVGFIQRLDNSTNQLEYPYLELEAAVINVNPNTNLANIFDDLDSGEIQSEPYFFEAGYPDKDGCYIPESSPPPELPPPPPPPEKDCCRMGCCPKPTQIDYRLIKRLMTEVLKEQKFSVDVPIVKCELNQQTNNWETITSFITLDFFATSKEQAKQMAQIHFENAIQSADLCLARNSSQQEPIASLPLSWQIRHEGRTPQMVIQCAEVTKDANGKVLYGSAKYPITVPHWKGGQNDKPKLPPYRKGNYEGILVLSDNTKVTVNAQNQAECTKIINAIKPWIPKQLLKGSYFKGGMINSNIKNTLVKPMYGRYFGSGQRNNKPDWRVDFP